MKLEYFKLIDRIIDLDRDHKRIRAEAAVPRESTIFEGHFPGYPLMPGVLLTEAMAQASGWLIIARTGFTRMPFLAAIKQAKLRSFVSPGADLVVEVEFEHEGSGYAATAARIMQDDKKVCDAQLMFRLVPFPAPELVMHMRRTAREIGFPMGTAANG